MFFLNMNHFKNEYFLNINNLKKLKVGLAEITGEPKIVVKQK